MNIYFIRHAEPDYSTDSITEMGKKQAELLAQAVKDFEIDEVYQSSMGRAQQTADYCLKKWNKSVTTLDWLKELCWGDKSGNAYASDSPWTIVSNNIKNVHAYPAGDSWKETSEMKKDRLVEDLENRCKAFDTFLAEQGYVRQGQLYCCEKANSKNIAFFCHGGITSALISYALNIPFFQFIAHTGPKVTSISKLQFNENLGFDAAKLDYFNDYSHLRK
ncbi:MAG: histidine phosphatase family protein [Treponema sp.]|nr:histidine phosphatase family protein [Treponema sp.]